MAEIESKQTNNMVLQRVAIIVTLLGTLSGAAVGIDSRYANASEVKQQFIDMETKQGVAIGKLESRFNRDAGDRLRDEIFKLEFKRNDDKLSSLEAAMLERYKRSLKKIEDEEAKD